MLPPIVYIALIALSLGIAVARHGQPRTDKYSLWTSLIAVGVEVFILWWGGFFNPLFVGLVK